MTSTGPNGYPSAIEVARTQDFEVRVHLTNGGRATVKLRGELDLCSADLFEAVLNHHIASGRRHIRLDMSGVTFVDCAGLGAIVDAHNTVVAKHGRLELIRLGLRTARLLEITELDATLHVEPTPPIAEPSPLATSF
jgi:anti-sigma B factor antagonist